MSHLSKEQRYTIDRMVKEGYSQVEIAGVINKNKSVVCREIHRYGEPNGSYCAVLAHKKYLNRQKEKPKKVSFTERKFVKRTFFSFVKKFFSSFY